MTPKAWIFFYLLPVWLLMIGNSSAQTCSGALGDPVLLNDFGRGTATFGPALINSTTYNFNGTGTPSDGSYTITKTTAGMHIGSWHQISNHSSNDPDGYMMIVNANDNPGVFYEAEVPIDLCPNTTYEFAAWVINLLTYNGKKPNLTFAILDLNNLPLAAPYNTNDIPEGSASDWKQYGFLFTTTGNINRVKIRITNNGPGGTGNDIAIDDITFRPCGPVIVPSIDGTVLQNKSICAGDTKSFILTADVTPGVYNNPQYLWQEMQNGQWQDIPTEISNKHTKNFVNAVPGDYKYRLLVSDLGNINTASCRTASPEFTLKVAPLPQPIVEPTLLVCTGMPIQLSVSPASAYKWTGPNGFTATDRTPLIPNAAAALAGRYEVTVINESGCEQTVPIDVSILPAINAKVDPVAAICQGTSVQLNASGGTSYSWSPTAGLSNPSIANPIANPRLTTTYTVTVANGACETAAAVVVSVNENARADAGEDQKILEGQQVTLNGAVSDDSDFFWSPAEGLDDSYKLNPVAAPTRDITYTLNAISQLGCSNAADQVVVKVYQTVVVPNAFSPNGDGRNDLWNLIAIDTYANASVKVMNRYGRLVFEDSAGQKPWNGKYKNEDLPAGVYYYIIQLNSELKPLTGSVMLIR